MKLLYLCTGNSCRSQMAEAWTRRLHGGQVEVHSAGVAPTTLDPVAVTVMAEEGVELAAHRSKHLDELNAVEFTHVITVCGHARETCPVFPADACVAHVGFDDPPALALAASDQDEVLAHYRRVRDEIRAFVEGLPEFLETLTKP